MLIPDERKYLYNHGTLWYSCGCKWRNYKMVKNSKTPKNKPIDSDRETRVLLENISRDVTRIAEAQSSTAAQIADVKATMATKTELNTVSMAVMQISSDVKNIDKRLKTVEEKLDKDLDNHEKRITKVEEKVHA